MCTDNSSYLGKTSTDNKVFSGERRVFERIPTSLPVNVLLGIVRHHGFALNLSENGMYIKTGMPLAAGLSFEVLLPSGEDVKVPVRVSRIAKSNDFYNGCGVVLLNQPQKYLNIVSSFRKKFQSKTRLQVSDEALKLTTRCMRNFKCLTAETTNICKAERPIKGGGIFIKEKVRETCNYAMPFGFSSFICNCPTRREIYDRYSI
jgi:hypothetical protein